MLWKYVSIQVAFFVVRIIREIKRIQNWPFDIEHFRLYSQFFKSKSTSPCISFNICYIEICS